LEGLGARLTAKRPEISLQTTDKLVTRMFETDPDFVFTVSRDFVRSCQDPVLILPNEVPSLRRRHGMRDARAQVRSEHVPVEKPKERIPLAVRQIHSFLRAHRPA
jgi:hypothetical protein